MSGTTFGEAARRDWLKRAVDSQGLQALIDDLDCIVAELEREWSEDDTGAALYLKNAHALIRELGGRIGQCC